MKRGRKPKQVAKEQQKQEEISARMVSSNFQFANVSRITSQMTSPKEKDLPLANASFEFKEDSILVSN